MIVEVNIVYEGTTVSITIHYLEDGKRLFLIRRTGDEYNFSITVRHEKLREMFDMLAIRFNFPTDPASVFTVSCDKETPINVSGKESVFSFLQAASFFEPTRCESPDPFESDLAADGW